MSSRGTFEAGITNTSSSSSVAKTIFIATFGSGAWDIAQKTGANWSVRVIGTDMLNRPIYRVVLEGYGGYNRDVVYANGRVEQPVFHSRATLGTDIGQPSVGGGVSNPQGLEPVEVGRPGESSLYRQNDVDRKKDQLAVWIANQRSANLIGPETANQWMTDVMNSTNTEELYSLESRFVRLIANQTVAITDTGDGLPTLPALGGGGFGGGGISGPIYQSPDRGVVEDLVKENLLTLIGEAPDEMVNRFTDLYLAEHRKSFDRSQGPGEQIDPNQSLKEAIRGTAEYQTIHQLRPDSVDERVWISQRRGLAEKGGLDTEAQNDFAIAQAKAGGDLADIPEAAATAQFQKSGQAPELIRTQMQQTLQAMFSRVVR